MASSVCPLLRAAGQYADRVDLRRFRTAVRRRWELGPKARLSFCVSFALEGGMRADPHGGGPGHETKAGLTRTILRRLNDVAIWRRLYGDQPCLPMPREPSRLTVDQVAVAYRFYLDDVLWTVARDGNGLDAIRDGATAAAVFDTLFQHGRRGGAIILQRAINDVIATLDGRPGLRSPIDVDGRMGPQTFGALLVLDRAQHTGALLEAIAKRRTAYQRANGQVVTRARHDLFRKFES